MTKNALWLLVLTCLCLCPPLAVNARAGRQACRPEALELLARFRGPQDADEAPPDADCFYDVGANITLLHEGVRRGLTYTSVSQLLIHGANVGVKDPVGATPLHWAAQYCSRAATGAMCATLRRQGYLDQVLNTRDISGVTALDEAEMAGCVGVAVLLAKLGAQRARHHGASDCRRELVNAVLHSDAIALDSGLRGRDADCSVAQHLQSWSLLHLATAAADFAPSSHGEAMLSVLLAHGADASYLDSKGQSPLFLAVATDRSPLVAALLEASPTALHHQDFQQRTPLHHAALRGARSVVKLLLKHGARLDVRDIAAKTPLDYAMDEGHTKIALLLTPRDKDEFDFQLPPNGGLIEGGLIDDSKHGDGHVVLGGVLGGLASVCLLCIACICVRARRRRCKVLAEDIAPPKIIVDPMGPAKPALAIHDAKDSLGPRLGVIANTEQRGPQPPKIKKRLKSPGKKTKSPEKISDTALCVAEEVVERTEVEEIASPGPPSPNRHQSRASPKSSASQRRARERLERRSRSQIYSTRIVDEQACDVQELALSIEDTPTRLRSKNVSTR
eukprot:gnl/MRDRNA2_/MRDRNA2_99652_c0_seq1.p1 gnl/MRDRNA2_/MRDRNA2_99652_c0~~gnl/MRDRNA2_/MRDRNA2_99652_c0_seq1.p1  ORF type:complete len:561 (+),score=105.99 gnl/MRDRNA2_/MRDRNA2_99652_c0_seq1:214-1896(+)